MNKKEVRAINDEIQEYVSTRGEVLPSELKRLISSLDSACAKTKEEKELWELILESGTITDDNVGGYHG